MTSKSRFTASAFALLMCATACEGQPQVSALRAQDRECEVVVSQRLHQIADVWAKRYGIIVWCRSAGAPAAKIGEVQQEGEITVTVSPANGQEETVQAELQRAEDVLRTTLEGIVKREGWETKYPKRFLQAVP